MLCGFWTYVQVRCCVLTTNNLQVANLWSSKNTKCLWEFPSYSHEISNTSSYYTLMMWFPDLFERFGHYGKIYPGEPASVCQVTSVVTVHGEVGILVDIFYRFLY